MNNLKPLKLVGIIYSVIILTFISLSLKTLEIADDKYFSDALLNRSLFDFLYLRYHGWTGRIPIEAIMVMTINHSWFYKIIVPFSLSIMAASLIKIAIKGRHVGILSFCVSLTMLLLIDGKVMGNASWWIAGAYNYLLPIAAGLLSLAIFYTNRQGALWTKILAIILGSFACYNEVYSIAVAIPAAAIIAFARKDYGKYSAIYIMATLANTIFSLTAPGNKLRFYSEIHNWLPVYENFNFINKVALGFDRLSSHITEQNALFVIFLGLLAACVILQKKTITGTQLLAMVIISFKIAIFFTFTRYSDQLKFFTQFEYLDLGGVADIEIFFKYIFSLAVLFSCASLMISMCESIEELINIPCVLVFGVASVVMIGLSPTVYASGYRVVFIFDLSIVYVCLYMLFNKLPIKMHNASP